MVWKRFEVLRDFGARVCKPSSLAVSVDLATEDFDAVASNFQGF